MTLTDNTKFNVIAIYCYHCGTELEAELDIKDKFGYVWCPNCGWYKTGIKDTLEVSDIALDELLRDPTNG
jgi:hypothetical protein